MITEVLMVLGFVFEHSKMFKLEITYKYLKPQVEKVEIIYIIFKNYTTFLLATMI